MVNITGLDKAEVLAALYNKSKQQGLGFLNAAGQQNTTADEVRHLLETNTYFDYLNGRVLKVDLSKDEFDPWGYDRDNGDGAAQRAIDTIKTRVVPTDHAEVEKKSAKELFGN